MSNSAKWFRVRVTDLKTGTSKTDVNLPLSLVNFGMRMGIKFAPAAFEGLDMDQVVSAIENGGEGKMVDVDDYEKGEHVEIFIQ